MDPRHDKHERPSRAADAGLMQNGDVAERTGVSLRTIRSYEETGLIAPSGRTLDGFRLYTEADRERLTSIPHVEEIARSAELCEARCERLRAQYEAAARFTGMLRSESSSQQSSREVR